MACSYHAHAQLDIEVTADTLNFGIVDRCTNATDSFAIINRGDVVFAGLGLRKLNAFSVASDSANIFPGDTLWVYVTFATAVGNFQERFIYSFQFTQTERVTDTVYLIGTRLGGPCLELSVPDVSGMIGSTSSLSLVQTVADTNLAAAGINVRCVLVYNPTIVVPTALPVGVNMLMPGQLEIQAQLRDVTPTVLVDIPCVFVLGDSSQCALLLTDVTFSDPTMEARLISGKASVTGFCLVPTTRYFSPAVALAIRGESHSVRIENLSRDPQRACVFNSIGAIMYHAVLEPLSTVYVPLPLGAYFVRTNDRAAVPLLLWR
jgi:hypothetical protein